jgi:transcriptional regulator with XRE-family HTH domain
MKRLGEQLRKLRQNLNFSLNDVYQKTGIHDSVLSHIEKGETQNPAPATLKKLAGLYNINVISLYLLCGYLDKNDLTEYQRCFSGVALLTKEGKDLVQKQIDILTKKSQR